MQTDDSRDCLQACLSHPWANASQPQVMCSKWVSDLVLPNLPRLDLTAPISRLPTLYITRRSL